MERNKKCSRIEIEIYFHEKGDNPDASHYQLKYLPHDLDFYILDAVKQGGFVGRYAFKIQDRKTLDEVIDLLEEKIREAYEEDISIGIVSQNHDRYEAIPVPIKIYVPGNHDATCFLEEKRVRHMCKEAGITYLNKEGISVYGLSIWGDPMTPEFGSWYFSTTRSKIAKHWDLIPESTDILITHGPRKGILDLSTMGGMHLCGDSALGKRIDSLPNLKLHCFGHIHDSSEAMNTGIRERNGIYYSNAAAVKDNEFSKGFHYHGNTFLL